MAKMTQSMKILRKEIKSIDDKIMENDSLIEGLEKDNARFSNNMAVLQGRLDYLIQEQDKELSSVK